MSTMNMRFDISWVGHCEHGDKIWGWFRDKNADNRRHDNLYCFWANRGKTISFTKYNSYDSRIIADLQQRKVQNKYVQLKLTELVDIWPDFLRDLENKFIWDKLAEKI